MRADPVPPVALRSAARGARPSGPYRGLLLGLLLAGCGPKHPSVATERVQRYRLSLQAQTQTRTWRPPSEVAPPEPDPVALGLAPYQQQAVQLEALIELRPSREFDDGSLGWLVHFVEVQGTVLLPDPQSDDGAAALVPTGPASPWQLQGRSVELRTFPDGEVLAVDLAEHLVGAGRPGELLDVLFPVLSPFPPELDAGATTRRTSRWPLTVGGPRGWRHALHAAWTNQGLVPDGAGEGAPAWRFTYEGPTEVRGGDPEARPPVGVQGRGQLRGEVWLDDVDTDPVPLRVLRHGFHWERSHEIEFPAAVGGPVRVVQDQVIDGTVERLPLPGSAP